MNNIIVTVALFFSSTSLFAQTTDNQITLKSGFSGIRFYQNERKMNFSQAAEVMKSNEKAYSQIKSAASNNTLASIIGAIGGGLVGYPVGTSLGGGNPNWTLAAIGGGLIVASIPLSIKAKKQSQEAVATFNDGLKKTTYRKTDLHLRMNGNGLGLAFHL